MLDEHLGDVADRRRLNRFRAAVDKVLHTGDRVTDLGCGSGVLGLLCLQAGASRVFAIDSTPMIRVAREVLARAGLQDRCVFVPGHSHRVELPEPAHPREICDQVGYFGFDYGIVDTLQDARRRFLKPGGRRYPRESGCRSVRSSRILRAAKPMAGRPRAYARSSIGCVNTR